jgi:flagellar protein FlbD
LILLTRLDQRVIALNDDRIAWIDACPDTTLRLVDGDVLVVLEPMDEVVRRIVAHRGAVLREGGLGALLAVSSAADPRLGPAPDRQDEQGEALR